MKIHKFLGGETQYSRRSLNFLLTNKISIKMSYKSEFFVNGARCTREDNKLSDLFASVQMFIDLGYTVEHLTFTKISVAV